MTELVAEWIYSASKSLWLHTFEILVVIYVLIDLVRNERERIRAHRVKRDWGDTE